MAAECTGSPYVIIPTEFPSLQAVLDEALAPFRRGGVDDFPRDKLAFDDVTETILRLHRETITLKSDGASIAVVGGSTMAGDLDFEALREFLLALCAPTWSGARRCGEICCLFPAQAFQGGSEGLFSPLSSRTP